MEGRTTSTNGSQERAKAADGWEAWEAIPRDGPAIFVVDTVAFDHGIVRGGWLALADGPAGLQAELTALLGRDPEAGPWAVVDQIGLGPVMAPEIMTVAELVTVESELGTGRAG